MLLQVLRLYSEKQGRRKHGIMETVNPYQIELVKFAACTRQNVTNLNRIDIYALCYKRDSEASSVELI